MNQIPLLQANDIECRIQSVSKNRSGEVGAVLLLYKNARVDMRILDEVFGPMGWQRTHEVVKDNLFCSIDIWDAEKQTWVRKQDVGVPSNTEAEKGEASDSFKRAGTNVGIGRELYTSPVIYVKLNEGEYYEAKAGGKTVYRAQSWVRFTVSDIEYNDRREIVGLIIKDRKGGVAFTYGSNKQNKANNTTKEKTAEKAADGPHEAVLLCADCNKLITDRDGITADRIAKRALGKYGRMLCYDCAITAKAMQDEAKGLDQQYKDKVG